MSQQLRAGVDETDLERKEERTEPTYSNTTGGQGSDAERVHIQWEVETAHPKVKWTPSSIMPRLQLERRGSHWDHCRQSTLRSRGTHALATGCNGGFGYRTLVDSKRTSAIAPAAGHALYWLSDRQRFQWLSSQGAPRSQRLPLRPAGVPSQ